MTICVLDTDVVIAALDRADASHRAGARLLRALQAGGDDIAMSLVNYAEALVRPAQDEAMLRLAIAAISGLGVATHRPTGAIAKDAARLRSHRSISLADGFALATARALDADLGTFDRRVQSVAEAEGLALAPGLA